MKRMGIEDSTALIEALEYYPQIFPVLQQIGMCCINPENENMTMEELCLHYGVDSESFLDVLNQML